MAQRDSSMHVKDDERLTHTFATARLFHQYCKAYRKKLVVDDGWQGANIHLDRCEVNTTGCYRCPLKLLERLLYEHGGSSALIPFCPSTDLSGVRTFSTPWNTCVYESYVMSVPNGHVVTMDFYSDGTTLSNSGTQSASFLRIRFSNIRPVSERWFTIAIAPTPTTIPSNLPYELRRKLRLELYQRFIHLVFADVISASYSGLVLSGFFFFPRLAMLIADQPEERCIMCFKRQGSLMDCTHCSLPTRLQTIAAPPAHSNNIYNSTSDEDAPTVRRSQKRSPNTTGQLSPDMHAPRDVALTLEHQLCVALFNRRLQGYTHSVTSSRRLLISTTAHDLSPSFGSFAGLGSWPHNLYKIVSFDKLYVMDLGLIRQFCDLVHSVLQRTCSIPLSRTMAALNDRYISLPPQAYLSSHVPLRTTHDDTQAGLSGSIRRESAPFLWTVIMGLSDQSPNDDNLLQCALHLDSVSSFLCNPTTITDADLTVWQTYIFKFGVLFASEFQVYISTKLHRAMRHIKDHIRNLGCLRRGSSEENEQNHKYFKRLVVNTNRHIDTMASQLITAWVDTAHDDQSNVNDDDRSSSDDDSSTTVSKSVHLADHWSDLVNAAVHVVQQNSGCHPPLEIGRMILQLHSDGTNIWQTQKSVRLPSSVYRFYDYSHKTLYGGQSVYRRSRRHDAVLVSYNGVETPGFIETVLAVRRRRQFPSTHRLVLLRVLCDVTTEPGIHHVVAQFGHKRLKYSVSPSGFVHTALVPRLQPASALNDRRRSLLAEADAWRFKNSLQSARRPRHSISNEFF